MLLVWSDVGGPQEWYTDMFLMIHKSCSKLHKPTWWRCRPLKQLLIAAKKQGDGKSAKYLKMVAVISGERYRLHNQVPIKCWTLIEIPEHKFSPILACTKKKFEVLGFEMKY